MRERPAFEVHALRGDGKKHRKDILGLPERFLVAEPAPAARADAFLLRIVDGRCKTDIDGP